MPRFKGKHHMLHPLRYGPYTVLNVYLLELFAQFNIHDVLNVNNIKLFEPPFLEEITIVQHPMENILDVQPHRLTDKILDSNTRTTR